MIATSVLIGTLIPSKTHGDIPAVMQILTPIDVLSKNPTPEELKLAAKYVAVQYGLEEELLIRTLECESNFRYNAVGDNGKAVGVAQFHFPTWAMYCAGDYYSARDQLICMSEMWQRNLEYHWSCWRKLK